MQPLTKNWRASSKCIQSKIRCGGVAFLGPEVVPGIILNFYPIQAESLCLIYTFFIGRFCMNYIDWISKWMWSSNTAVASPSWLHSWVVFFDFGACYIRKKWLCTQLPGWTFCFTPGYTRNSLIMSVLQAFDVCLRVDHSSNANTMVILFHVEMQNTCIIYRIFCLLFFKNPFFFTTPFQNLRVCRGGLPFGLAPCFKPKIHDRCKPWRRSSTKSMPRAPTRSALRPRGVFHGFHGFGETCWTTHGVGEFCECKVYE